MGPGLGFIIIFKIFQMGHGPAPIRIFSIFNMGPGLVPVSNNYLNLLCSTQMAADPHN